MLRVAHAEPALAAALEAMVQILQSPVVLQLMLLVAG